jgi:hypothetical protein
MNVQRELEKFLRQQLFRERSEPITAIELRHAASGSKGNLVDDFDFSSVNTDNVDSFVDEIQSRAQSDASGIGGVQRYELHVITKDKRIGARFAFRVRGDDEDMDGVAGDEAANQRGLLTQLMRHNEQQNRTMVNSVGAVIAMLQRTNERLEDENQMLREERRKNWDLIDAAKGRDHERELELLDAHRKGEREDMMFQKINTLFPVILNRLTGKEMMPVEDKNLLMSFVDTLNEEQFQKILSTLKPEQQILLLTVIKEMKQKSLSASNGQS